MTTKRIVEDLLGSTSQKNAGTLKITRSAPTLIIVTRLTTELRNFTTLINTRLSFVPHILRNLRSASTESSVLSLIQKMNFLLS